MVNVIGWYDKGNVGDESYRISLPILFPQTEFTFAHTVKNTSAPVYVLGGGDVVNPAVLSSLSKVSGRKFIMSVSISNDLDSNLLKQFEQIIVRDFDSLRRLKEIGVAAKYAPDFAFAIKPNPVAGRAKIESIYKKEDLELYENVVVVILNSHLVSKMDCYHKACFDKFVNDLYWVCDNTCASFLFIPFSTQLPWDDRVPNAWVASHCKFWKKNCIFYDVMGVQDCLDVISAANAVLSTRLHSSIFSVVAATPFVDITHNHKNKQFLSSIGQEHLSLPYVKFDRDECKRRLDAIFVNTIQKFCFDEVAKSEKNILNEIVKNIRF